MKKSGEIESSMFGVGENQKGKREHNRLNTGHAGPWAMRDSW